MLDWNGNTFRNALSVAWRKHVTAFIDLFGPPASKEVKKSTFETALAALKKFEENFGDHHYVAGDSLSIADIQIFFELTLFLSTFSHIDLHKEHHKLAAWYDRVANHDEHMK